MPLELRQLRHVLALAQHGSLVRAAAAMHMTQPALSRSLKQIEWAVGSTLFDRSVSGVTPTDQGRLLIRRARELVDAADELDREVLRGRVGGSDQFSIGAGPYPAETVVPAALVRFVPDNPLVRVRMVRADWDDLLRRLKARELDFFVAEFSTLLDEHELTIEPLGRHQVYFVARRGHPLDKKSVVRAEETFAYPFVAISRYPPRVLDPMLAARQPVDAKQPGRPFPAIECCGVAAAKRIIADSDAVAPLMLSSVAEELRRGALAVVGTESWSFANYAIVSLRNQAMSAAAGRFQSCLNDAEAALAREESRLVQRYVPKSQPAPMVDGSRTRRAKSPRPS